MNGDRRSSEPLRVAVAGLRGFPGVPGGVESHAQQLYPRLAERGCDVEVFVRSPHLPPDAPRCWKGVRMTPLWSPARQGMEALVHTVSAIVSARRVRPNVLHLHNIGPALAIPLARALGFPVVVTHHSLNYRHEKWGSAARFLLRAGERSSARLAAARIAVSREIQEVLAASYGASSVLIPNGVALEPWEENSGLLDRLGLQPRRYVLFVGRFSPEKRLLDLIEAFSRAAVPGWSLALTGGVTLDDAYRRRVVERAGAIPGVVLTGFQDGAQLAELYARAGCFALPSSHEGQPLALLEALASGAPSIASDIPAHRALALPEESYFPPCEIDALAGRLRLFAESGIERDRWTVLSSRILSEFDWERVADRTLEVLAGAARRASAAMA